MTRQHQISYWSSSSSSSSASISGSRPSFTTVFAVTPDGNDNGDVDNDDDDEQYMEIESLSSGQIIELIELSFFQACFALSKGDVDPLKLFIIAVKTAAKKYEGASASAISQTVNSLPPSVRPLEPQEQELRDTWIRAIYLMLGHVVIDFADGSATSSNDDDDVAQTYGPILADLVAIHETGLGLNVNQFVSSRKDILLPKPKGNMLVLEDGPDDEDLVQLAVVTQTINVLFTTIVVLDEENSDTAAEDESSSSSKKNKKSKGGGGKGFGQ